MLIYVKKTYLSRVKTFFRTIIIRYKHLLSYLLPPLQIFVLQDCNVDDFWFYNKFNRSLFLFKYLSNTISTPCSMNSAKPMCTEYGINILLRLYFLHLYLINVYDNDWQQFWLSKVIPNAHQVRTHSTRQYTSLHHQIVYLLLFDKQSWIMRIDIYHMQTTQNISFLSKNLQENRMKIVVIFCFEYLNLRQYCVK